MCTLFAHLKKKEVRNSDLHSRKSLAEVHGNRTHLPPSSDGTPDLKSGGPTSEPGTSTYKCNLWRQGCQPGGPGEPSLWRFRHSDKPVLSYNLARELRPFPPPDPLPTQQCPVRVFAFFQINLDCLKCSCEAKPAPAQVENLCHQ